ncbi:hypothetical protein EYF80_033706 [Liparis tanakae]|uniref:Uncharacterized protein n=1 Tax=Liparis tanakae TaxID=230148 RepID=A0A4Z2GSI0_9TELE|nr:hypothetical protein EYF80_033706 [Liparis tanakae]
MTCRKKPSRHNLPDPTSRHELLIWGQRRRPKRQIAVITRAACGAALLQRQKQIKRALCGAPSSCSGSGCTPSDKQGARRPTRGDEGTYEC